MKNKLIFLGVVFTASVSVQCFANAPTQVTLPFPADMFIGASDVRNALEAFKVREEAEVSVSSLKFVEVQPMRYKICAKIQRDGGDFISTIGAIEGLVVGVSFPRGTAYQIEGTQSVYSSAQDTCDVYLGDSKS